MNPHLFEVAAAVAAAMTVPVTVAVQLVKCWLPARWGVEDERAVGLTFVVSVLLTLAAWALQFLPAAVSWNAAILAGILAAWGSSGLYSHVTAGQQQKDKP